MKNLEKEVEKLAKHSGGYNPELVKIQLELNEKEKENLVLLDKIDMLEKSLAEHGDMKVQQLVTKSHNISQNMAQVDGKRAANQLQLN